VISALGPSCAIATVPISKTAIRTNTFLISISPCYSYWTN
jgi:hypothetical protein